MSKSLGNILAIRDILREHHPEALRIFLLSNHYRSPVDFSLQNMVEARANLDRFYTALKGIAEALRGREEFPPLVPEKLKGTALEVNAAVAAVRGKVLEAMDDDFNTALALGHLHELGRLLNRALADKGFRKDPAAGALLKEGRGALLESGRILGLFRETPGEYFAGQQKRFLTAKGLPESELSNLIARREEARRSKDWKTADEMREKAAALGIALEDGPQGTTWRPA
jgi:cysteinyl-tRNA synthetase